MPLPKSTVEEPFWRHLEVHDGGGLGAVPGRADFSIHRGEAERILALSRVVARAKALRIEEYSLTAEYFEEFDPVFPKGSERDDGDEPPCEGVKDQRLVVEDDQFFFAAEYQGNAVYTDTVPLGDLAQHFGLPWSEPAPLVERPDVAPDAPDLTRAADEALQDEMRSRGLLDDNTPRMR